MILGEKRVLSLIYSYVAVFMFCAVSYAIIIITFSVTFWLLDLCFIIFFTFHFVSYFCFPFCVFCLLLCLLFLLLCCLFPIFGQAYRLVPLDGNPNAVNKYHIIQYIIPYHIILTLKWIVTDSVLITFLQHLRMLTKFIAARLACTIVPIVLCNTVYYAVLLMMND